MVFWFRACPTCGGDLYLANDEANAVCFQCARPMAVRVVKVKREAVAA